MEIDSFYLEIFIEPDILIDSSEDGPQKKLYLKGIKHHVICSQGKRSRFGRVRNHSRARSHRRHCSYAFARTQDWQHLQYHQQWSGIICPLELKKSVE